MSFKLYAVLSIVTVDIVRGARERERRERQRWRGREREKGDKRERKLTISVKWKNESIPNPP